MTWFEPSPRLSVRCLLSDERVADLRSEIQGLAIAGVADCDVLAAHNYLVGDRSAWSLPACEFDAPIDTFFELLKVYAQQLDNLWNARGGYTPEGFRSFVLWLLRHRHRMGSDGGFGGACGAYLYGDRALAQTLLMEFEAGEARLAAEDPRPIRQEVYAKIRTDIERLRAVIGRNPR